ncbi:hypothetical protein Fmac_007166 [Flemingia macrophylla]|uniref:Mitochondrial carrier protein n=1 Tax=Flemingia macrophylla TaxID=520843 RepID=A0ABD1NCN6_9FABA
METILKAHASCLSKLKLMQRISTIRKRVSNVNNTFEYQLPHATQNRRTGFFAAGAAFVSAIIVNPLDVAKTRLQAQAAGVPCRVPSSYQTNTMMHEIRCPAIHSFSGSECPSGCNRYKGTLDVFYKVIRQEGFMRLWRGTNASLALAVPTVGIYLPCYDIFQNMMEEFTTQNAPKLTPYVPLVAGSVARSLACISCYPVELARTRMQAFRVKQGGKPPGVWKTLLGVIHSVDNGTGIIYGGLALEHNFLGTFHSLQFAGQPLSQLGKTLLASWVMEQKDPERALKMTTRTTLIEIWRDGGLRGLFTGVGPRVGRAGPSVGIVVSFYEVVKFALQNRHPTSS